MYRHDLFCLFSAIFTISSFAGLAALLRSGRPIGVRTVVSAMLNSGLLAVGIGLVWYHYFPANITFIFGVSLLAGLGGINLTDILLTGLRKGLHIEVKLKEERK